MLSQTYVGNSTRTYVIKGELGYGYGKYLFKIKNSFTGKSLCQDVQTNEKYAIKILKKKNFLREVSYFFLFFYS